MDPGTQCSAGRQARLVLYLDKTIFFNVFCLFVLFLGSFFFFFFTASPDLLTGCWVDRHLRFFCARVLMFHL